MTLAEKTIAISVAIVLVAVFTALGIMLGAGLSAMAGMGLSRAVRTREDR